MSESTKKKIIRKAWEMFNERGYDKVTVNDICEACSITKPTFYYHMRSKEEIISRFYDSITNNAANQLQDLSKVEHFWDLLMLCFERLIIDSSKLSAEISSRVLIMNLQNDQGTYDFDEELTATAVELIRKGQLAGEIRNQSPPEQLYRASAYTFMGYEITWCVKKGCFDRARQLRLAFEQIYDLEPSLRQGGTLLFWKRESLNSED